MLPDHSFIFITSESLIDGRELFECGRRLPKPVEDAHRRRGVMTVRDDVYKIGQRGFAKSRNG